ncbi:hypothetical protein OBBRIDRAFT_791301 [Obba rivulosa]|uniref:Uncharacterized protein n=1 Tax=Obba rivulosa TaxID=1052685 RepID=A0A8E2DN96_9APHY|nr:hypothetical protein OBBRIDRAFT_791301 [Obba rivulosa]
MQPAPQVRSPSIARVTSPAIFVPLRHLPPASPPSSATSIPGVSTALKPTTTPCPARQSLHDERVALRQPALQVLLAVGPLCVHAPVCRNAHCVMRSSSHCHLPSAASDRRMHSQDAAPLARARSWRTLQQQQFGINHMHTLYTRRALVVPAQTGFSLPPPARTTRSYSHKFGAQGALPALPPLLEHAHPAPSA